MHAFPCYYHPSQPAAPIAVAPNSSFHREGYLFWTTCKNFAKNFKPLCQIWISVSDDVVHKISCSLFLINFQFQGTFSRQTFNFSRPELSAYTWLLCWRHQRSCLSVTPIWWRTYNATLCILRGPTLVCVNWPTHMTDLMLRIPIH